MQQQRITSFLKFWLYGSVDKAQFYSVYDDIIESNRRSLVFYGHIGTLAMLLLVGCSYFVDSLVKVRTYYVVYTILCALITVVSGKLIKNSIKGILICMYVFIGLLYSFGIALGTFLIPEEVSVSFPILLFAVPLLFTDYPIRMAGASICAIVVYIIAASFTQSPALIEYNLSNIIPYGLVSMIASAYLNGLKINRHVLERENRILVERDQMTGLLNRRSCHRLIESFGEPCPKNVIMYVLDVNGLKQVNDTFGHSAGDDLLCAVADCITEVFGPYGDCFRVGGDEFVVILQKEYPKDEVLRKKLEEKCLEYKDKLEKEISLSIGCAESTGTENSFDLMAAADKAMYKEKEIYYKSLGINR